MLDQNYEINIKNKQNQQVFGNAQIDFNIIARQDRKRRFKEMLDKQQGQIIDQLLNKFSSKRQIENLIGIQKARKAPIQALSFVAKLKFQQVSSKAKSKANCRPQANYIKNPSQSMMLFPPRYEFKYFKTQQEIIQYTKLRETQNNTPTEFYFANEMLQVFQVRMKLRVIEIPTTHNQKKYHNATTKVQFYQTSGININQPKIQLITKYKIIVEPFIRPKQMKQNCIQGIPKQVKTLTTPKITNKD